MIEQMLAEQYAVRAASMASLETFTELQVLISTHHRIKVGLAHDLTTESERSRPSTSLTSAFVQTATATGVASLSALNGVASEVSLYEHHVGADVRQRLTRDATGVLGKVSATSV